MKVVFERHAASEGNEYVSGSMALFSLLSWVVGSEFEYKFSNDPNVFRDYVALGLLEARLSKVLIFDERLYEMEEVARLAKVDVDIVTVEGKQLKPKCNCIESDVLDKKKYDFVLCHESLLEDLRGIGCEKDTQKKDIWGKKESDDDNNKPQSVIAYLRRFLKSPEKHRLVIHTGRGKPDKLLEQNNTGSKPAPSELDDLLFADFVNLRFALMNGKYFLIQFLHALRRV